MSYTFTPPAPNDQQLQQHLHDVPEGQRHDRIQLQKQDTSTMAGSNPSTDITVTQRMISATVGSIATSLLGDYSKSSYLDGIDDR